MVQDNLNDNSQDQNNKVEHKEEHNTISTPIVEEMKGAYLEYAMSVIVGRALPDVRDGLKPVHRRILYAMNEMHMFHNKPSKKCARIVGEVLGKYHPHGDSAVYETLVRMAQDFSLRYPLIQGQGNFGSIDGDRAAAMRYTEAKLSKISNLMLTDIDKETVDFRPNFDESLEEPEVLPARIPNLLINGTNGIAVGMATTIPPHNLKEVISGTIAILNNEEITTLELLEHIKGPDFPTGGTIIGTNGIKNAYATGRGKIKIRGKYHFEEIRGRKTIIVTEIPYQVNKATLIEQIADRVRDKQIEGIHDIRDESNKKGIRVVIELKKDANEEVVINHLLKHTRLQTSSGLIFLSLVKGQPKVLPIKEILNEFIKHRIEVVTRRTQYELKKAKNKTHILEGLTKALDNIDAIIALIKKAESGSIAKQELQQQYEFSEIQAQSILDMKLQKLTGLEQDKIREEYENLLKFIKELEEILASKEKIKQIIIEELEEVNDKFGDERKTTISEVEDEDIDDEDLIPREDQVVTITRSGYAKRLPIETYKVQRRGGKGVIGATMKEEDLIEHLFVANTHEYLLIFTNKGKIYWLKVYKMPEGSRTSKGKALINLVNMSKEEHIAAIIPVVEFSKEENLFMTTKKGVVKKTSLDAYSRPRQTGIIGINLDEGDTVIAVRKTSGNDQILIGTKNGQAIRFNETDVRPIGRTGRGVRGISLKEGDEVIGSIIAKPGETILTVTENGYGKRTAIEDYRLINRGGKGVRNIICSERNGKVVTIRRVNGTESILLISEKGIIIRTETKQINTIGRNTQGVRLMNLNSGDKLQRVAVIRTEDNEDEEQITIDDNKKEENNKSVNTEEKNIITETTETKETNENPEQSIKE